MSPPSADFQSKDVKLDFPVCVQPQQAPKSSKKYLWISLAVCGAAVVITAGALGCVALYQHLSPDVQEFNTTATYNGLSIPEHAHVDYLNHITYVNNSRYGQVLAGQSILDYNKGLIVYKDKANGMCYLDKLDATFEEDLKAIGQSNHEVAIKDVVLSKDAIDDEVLRKFAGDIIADHCSGQSTYWVLDKQGEDNASTSDLASVPEPCTDSDTTALCREKRKIRIRISVRISIGRGIRVEARVSITF